MESYLRNERSPLSLRPSDSARLTFAPIFPFAPVMTRPKIAYSSPPLHYDLGCPFLIPLQHLLHRIILFSPTQSSVVLLRGSLVPDRILPFLFPFSLLRPPPSLAIYSFFHNFFNHPPLFCVLIDIRAVYPNFVETVFFSQTFLFPFCFRSFLPALP